MVLLSRNSDRFCKLPHKGGVLQVFSQFPLIDARGARWLRYEVRRGLKPNLYAQGAEVVEKPGVVRFRVWAAELPSQRAFAQQDVFIFHHHSMNAATPYLLQQFRVRKLWQRLRKVVERK